MKNKKLISYLFGFMMMTLIWFLLAFFINSKALVNPISVYHQLLFNFNPVWIEHIIASMVRIVISVLITMSLGCLLGLLMGYFKNLNYFLDPLIYFMYPIPKIALIPVIMTLQGLGDTSKITLIVLIAIFQVIIYIRDSTKHIPKQRYYGLISFGASHFQMLRYITLHEIKPAFFSSLRVTIATSFSILFIVEAYGTTKGLGYYIQDAWSRIDYLDMYVGIVILSSLCLLCFVFLDILENKLNND